MLQLKELIGWVCLITFSIITIYVFVTSTINCYEKFVTDISVNMNQQLPPGYI